MRCRMRQSQYTRLYDWVCDPEFSRLGPLRFQSGLLLGGWRGSVAEDDMMGCEVEGPFDLFTSPDKLYIVYLRLVSVSLISGP